MLRHFRYLPWAALALFFCFPFSLQAQSRPPLLSLTPADSFHAPRFWGAVVTGGVVYGASMIALHNAWYANYPTLKFHTFNDFSYWNQMDKMGHWLMSYNQSRWIYGGALWTGLGPKRSAWVGFAGSQLIMTSLEIFDGFSAQWGFSWGDVGANLLGSSMFLAQQLGWGEQRILMKWSIQPQRYATEPIYPFYPPGSENWATLESRARAIYGTGLMTLLLKDYNALTVWTSVNPRSFFSEGRATWLPRWLNIAVGMGAQHLYTAQGYEWKGNRNCQGPYCDYYRVDPQQYPRTRQLYLSLDIDLTRLPMRSRFLRTLAGAFNIVKVPAPTLEWTDQGVLRFHPLFF